MRRRVSSRIAGDIARKLEDAWNAADGAAYGAPFAPDADFVAIRGDLHSGPAIAAGHQAIFDTIHRDSTMHMEVIDARAIRDDVIVAHVRSQLHAPTGPLAGDNTVLATMVLTDGGDGTGSPPSTTSWSSRRPRRGVCHIDAP